MYTRVILNEIHRIFMFFKFSCLVSKRLDNPYFVRVICTIMVYINLFGERNIKIFHLDFSQLRLNGFQQDKSYELNF